MNCSAYSYVFRRTWMKFSTGVVHTNLFCDYAFNADWHSKSHGIHKYINEYTFVLFTLCFDLGEIGCWGT
jgi:hypothetical protein